MRYNGSLETVILKLCHLHFQYLIWSRIISRCHLQSAGLPHFIVIPLNLINLRLGVRDTDLAVKNTFGSGEMIEFYWDVILIAELQFILSYYLTNKEINYKEINNSIIKKVGSLLNSVIKNKKLNNGITNCGYNWRNIGFNYTLVYLPNYFDDFIWCKSDTVYFHAILPHSKSTSEKNLHAKSLVQDSREWLLALLELSSTLELSMMRLYLRRSEVDNISALLRNLNWIGGKLVSNEDRGTIPISNNSEDDSLSSFFGDEEFLILEFEC